MKISINDFNFILKSVSENVSVITGDNPITPTDIIHTSSGSVVIGYYNSSSTSIYNYNSSNPANPSTSYLLPTTSNNATFLAMINNSGALQWMSQIDGTYNEESVAVAPGSDGIYLSGRYNSNDVKVYQGALPNALSSYITLPTPSNDAIFLIKYSLNGSIQWATYIDGTSNEYNTAMAVYNDEIYLTGFYESIGTKAYYANPSNQYVELPSFNVYATFLVQYNKFGQVRWATKVENVHPEQNYILTADKNGVYLVGEFNLSDDSPLAYGFPSTGSGYPNVPSVTFSLDATDGFSIFVIRYLNNGVISWMNNMESGSDLYVKDVSADDSSLYILASHIGDSVVVNGTTNYSITIPTSTAVKSFITKYSYNGIVQLAFEPCSDDTQYEINTLMTHDNYLYFGGYFHSSQIAFISYNDARNLTLSGDATYHTGFLARYDKNGKIDWATTQTDPSAIQLVFILTKLHLTLLILLIL
jgi:hypothetical protein